MQEPKQAAGTKQGSGAGLKSKGTPNGILMGALSLNGSNGKSEGATV